MTRAEAKQRTLNTVIEATGSKGFSEVLGASSEIVVTNGTWWARANLIERNGLVDIVGAVRVQRGPFEGKGGAAPDGRLATAPAEPAFRVPDPNNSMLGSGGRFA